MGQHRPTHPNLYVLGNPPFLGHATRTTDQADELRAAWNRDDIGRLDYVTAWYAKAMDLFGHSEYDGEFAFVSTNSITQGEPVPALFGPIFEAGWRIKFAHRTFAWSSEAPGAAAVHCTIVGFDRHPRRQAWLYEYDDLRGEPIRIAATERINGYLADGPNVLIEQRRTTLSSGLPSLTMGNMPRDGGYLIVEPEDYDEFASDPVAAKYLREYVGSRQLIHAEPRWCLWLTDLEPGDVGRSPLLRERIEAVRKMRATSKAGSTRQMAETPHLFGQRSHVEVPHLIVPTVSSETRHFVPCSHVAAGVIASNLVFTAEDPDGYAFSVVSSSMFITWQKAVGGRLESRLRVSNTLTWNTFPLPSVTEAQRISMIAAGQEVLKARNLHPEHSLADHYNPLAMDPALLRAHRKLDKAVDQAFGLNGAEDEVVRLKALFISYAALTS